MANDYPPIPTHLVLGFLGAGKTTAILTLLKQKPAGETWAVLVNEFGEVGIDGALLRADGVAVKEVPGGCMCCVSGLPMQIGLNSLIRFNRPDRLFIEPTGLGHPSQIIATLTGQYYSDLLELSAAVCLVDPRRLDDPRTLENPQFQDQVAVADVLVASKADLCTADQLAHFDSWAAQWQPPKQRLFQSAGGDIDMSWLGGKFGERPARFPHSHGHNHGHDHDTRPKPDLSEQPWQCYSNKGEGFYSLGWRVHPETVFDALVLHQLAHQPDFERLKGVMHTTAGWLSLNASEGAVTLLDAEPAKESRMEIIGRTLDRQALDQSLQSAISKTA
ncbi:CobW family GTP-binding protein [Marinobacter salicampi]|uniref:CobW family GTP-binding protein n=1 Tax=Marinobacter salicampi TaxID=435907 RepID=UPI00140B0F4F|nr:GTP-binding protein [Marinobacter salicampi]